MEKIIFEKGKWIWENSNPMCDEYAEFNSHFTLDNIDDCLLKISCDSNYAAYINGKLAAFGQYADYPDFKVGDIVNVSSYVCTGENELVINVWYYGKGNMTYTPGKAGLIYEISSNGNTVDYSSDKTLSRLSKGYIPHKCVKITDQLGFTFEYDSKDKGLSYTNSAYADGISNIIYNRPIKKLELLSRTDFKKAFGGTYHPPKTETANLSEYMQKSALTFIRASREEGLNTPFELTSDDGGNVYFIIDICSEESGFLDFDITVNENCDIYIAYGEHLSDGRVRTHKRNFTCIYHAKQGRNIYTNHFRRFGCRYLEFFVESKYVKVDYAGIRPTVYPLVVKTPHTGNYLRDVIYKVSEKTLINCMHEHYEDCPWREQGLYTMDSRNQMLFGYYAFSEYEFPRASLYLISKGQRKKDNLLSICFPTDNPLTIPSFSLMYFIEMNEYIKYSNDKTLALECYPVLTKLMDAFLSRIDESGLCPSFYSDEKDYWGFYEWSETLTGVFGENEKKYECPLNAYLSLALQNMSEIAFALGKDAESLYYTDKADDLNREIYSRFWCEDKGLFKTTDNDNKYSVLVNAFCVLCGVDRYVRTDVIEKILLSNEYEYSGLEIVPITLSMHVFRYDALLKISNSHSKFILDDIDEKFLFMLRNGATSFWETIKGERDFDWVGSLCHGWSALPIYYYETLIEKEGE